MLTSTPKGELSQVSFGSLSMVVGIPKEQAKRIMTEFFAALIETSRKTQKEARINLKGFGTLYLFKNRELAFRHQEEAHTIDLGAIAGTKTSTDLFLARQREREDLSYIDGASAILSRGGGNTFSVKSSAWKSISNVGSVPSNANRSVRYSSTSSVVSGQRSSKLLNPIKKDFVWKKYMRRNAQNAKDREAKSAQNRGDVAVQGYNTEKIKQGPMKEPPASMNMRTHTNAPTTIIDLHSPKGYFREKLQNASAHKVAGGEVPYPYLSALVDRKNFDRFNKRVIFDRSDYDDLLN